MKKIALAILVLAVVAVAHGQNRNPANAGKAVKLHNPLTVGTVTYDTGAPADVFHLGNPSSGNLFNTNMGAPLISGTVNRMSLYVGTYFNAGTFTVWPGPVPMNSVYFFGTFSANTFNAFSFTPVAVQASFLAGMNGSLGFVTDSAGGQGFHGQAINWQSFTIQPYQGQNGMARVTGNILPVELMRFDVE
jgi:hypothetical protein